MKLVNQSKDTYILRLDPDEEFIETIQNFCVENNIKSAWLEAVGSTKELELAYFNVDEKEYETESFQEFLEIITITGNISVKEGEVFCHAHGIFGKSDMKSLAGHVNRCIISATGEVMLHKYEGKVERKYDENTGLHLLS